MGKVPNKAKGEFRPIYESLPDHPKFQCLQSPARLLLYVLKNTMGATGIQIVYPAVLSEQTGLPLEVVQLAAEELERVGWIRREWKVWWLVDGLEHEPNLSMKNEKHRTYVLNQIHALPRLQIIVDFIAHYGLDDPDSDGETIEPEAPDPQGYGIGYSMGYRDAYREPNPSPTPTPTQPLPSVTTSPVVEGKEPTAEDVENSKTELPAVTDAALRNEALRGLGLGRYVSVPDQARVSRELHELLHTIDRHDLLAALKGCAAMRDMGLAGFTKGQAYSPAVLLRWGRVWWGEGDQRTERHLLEIAQEIERRSHDSGQSMRGLTPISRVLSQVAS